MSDTVTIRADLVPIVRNGLRGAAGEAADQIVQATEAPGPKQAATGPASHRRALDRLCALLDVIGWADPMRPSAVQIDLKAHRAALAEGLKVAELVAEDALEDEAQPTAEPPCESPTERLERIRELAWAIGLRRGAPQAHEAAAA
jgi:hypothetical protein